MTVAIAKGQATHCLRGRRGERKGWGGCLEGLFFLRLTLPSKGKGGAKDDRRGHVTVIAGRRGGGMVDGWGGHRRGSGRCRCRHRAMTLE